MDNLVVIAIVIVFWTVLGIAARRHSLFPIFPFVPLALLGAGMAVNALLPWAGTALSLGLHVLLIVYGLARMKPKEPPN